MDLTPQTAKIAVRIDDVNMKDRTIHAIDKTGAKVRVSFREVPASFRIPASGEVWIAHRHGWVWYLDQRLDTVEEHADLATMSPGDTRVHAKGTVRTIAAANELNGNPLGSTAVEQFITTGTSADFNLKSIPVHNDTIQVFRNTDFLHQTVDYSVVISNEVATISLALTPTSGNHISVYYQRF